MIIQVNTKGIAIDVTGNATLTAKYGTELLTIFETDLQRFVKCVDCGEDVIRFTDLDRNEYTIDPNDITTINGVGTGFSDTVELWQTFNVAMLGL